MRYGVPQLYPHEWAFNQHLNKEAAKWEEFPILVKTVSTDGLQIKILTLTMVPKRAPPPEDDDEDESPNNAPQPQPPTDVPQPHPSAVVPQPQPPADKM